ncbi:MAG: hypothetical protein MI923_27790 [Phycisphaerales bacterium]|nr:hypothetical protein [Phycisphaerales bacterium]
MTIQRSTLFLVASIACCVSAVRAEDPVSFETSVKPILQVRCLNCHNPEKRRGGLDMTVYQNLLTGSSSGKIVSSGSPDESSLLDVIMHTREPHMPPTGNKLPDAEIETIRRWIQQGCRETPHGPAIAVKKKTVAQPLRVDSLGVTSTKVPLAWPLIRIVKAERADAVTSIATHPGSAVAALAAQQQVLVYHLPTQRLLGALTTHPAFPYQIRFSSDGRLIIAAGGVGAQSGFVRAWGVSDGALVARLDHSGEVVRAADIDAGMHWCALGGPSGIVRIHDLSSFSVVHTHEKHTDWITDIQYSPDGLLLATSDRAGGVFIWEAASHNLMHSLSTQPAMVTTVAWRGDSNLLATACEDGRVRIYEPDGGAKVKEWLAHAGGTSCVRWSRDGRMVTAGRDKLVKIWKPDFSHAGSMPALNDIALACAFDASGRRVVASDFSGTVRVFDVETGKALGELDANPKPFEEQMQHAGQRHAELKKRLETNRQKLEVARAALSEATASFDQASQELATQANELKQLRAAELRACVDEMRNKIAAVDERSRPVFEAAKVAESSVADATAALADARRKLASVDESIESNTNSVAAHNNQIQKLNDRKDELGSRLADREKARGLLVEFIKTTRPQADASPENEGLKLALENASVTLDLMTKEVDDLRTRLDATEKEISSMSSVLATLQSQIGTLRKDRQLAEQRIGDLQSSLGQKQKHLESHRLRVVKAKEEAASLEAERKNIADAYHAMLAEIESAFQ